MRVGEYVRLELYASIVEAALVAAFFAWFELRAQTGNGVILDHFAYWNLMMVPFAVTIFSVPFVGAWRDEKYGKVVFIVLADILLWILLEDVFWHLEQGIWVNSSDWVNWMLSGVSIPATDFSPTIWMPTVYIILAIASGILYFVAFRESEED